MFENLTDKFISTIQKLRGRISIEDVKEAITKIKQILIESDVSLNVANHIVEDLKLHISEKSIKSLNNDEILTERMHKILIQYLSHEKHGFKKMQRYMLVGLQGAGKTTMCGKIAHKLNEKNLLLVSLDNTRPAAKEQLSLIAKRLNVNFYSSNDNSINIAREALTKGKNIIFDSAGRHEDIDELVLLQDIIQPDCTIFVADAMYGQNIENIIAKFNKVHVDYIALSRIDSNAKLGAILTISYILKKPIILLGTGEKIEDYTDMKANIIADRILDKGDVVSLVERAKKEFKEEENKNLHQITLSDLVNYMDKIQNMGGLANILGYLPGMSKMRNMINIDVTNNKLKSIKAIVYSMTNKERNNPYILNKSRKNRIAQGSGHKISDIDDLLKVFNQTKQMISRLMKR